MPEIDYSKLDSQLHGIESTPAQEIPVSKRDNTSSAPETNPSVAVKPPQVTAPIAPPVVAQQPNVNDLATQAANANKTLETSAPAPVAPSPVQAMTGGTSGVAPVAVGALLGAGAMMGIHHLMKKSEVKPKDLDKKETVLNKENTGVIPSKQTEGQPQVVEPTESELVSPDQKLNETPVNIETPKGTEENPIVDTRPITKAEEQKAEEIFNSMDELKSVGDIGKEKVEPTVVNEEVKPVEKERGGESGKPRNNPTKEQRLNTYAEENKIARELHGQPTITTSDKPHEVLAETAKTPQMKEFYRQQYEGNDKLKKGVSEAYKTGRLNEGDIFIPNAGGGTAHFLNMNYNKGEDDVLKDYKAFRDTYYKGRPDIPYDAEYQKNLKEFNAKRNPASTIPGLETMTGEQVGKANPEETNFFGSKHLRKATIAGTTGIILTATQMAQAAEEANKGNYAPATYAGGEAVAGGLLSKLFGLGAKAGGAGLSAATYTPELNANEGKELAQRRYAYEMSKKNGAGRGQLNTSK